MPQQHHPRSAERTTGIDFCNHDLGDKRTGDIEMKRTSIRTVASVAVLLAFSVSMAAQDRYTVKVPDGLAFSEFKGYETWAEVAPSATEGSIKTILANPIMMSAYKAG